MDYQVTVYEVEAVNYVVSADSEAEAIALAKGKDGSLYEEVGERCFIGFADDQDEDYIAWAQPYEEE